MNNSLFKLLLIINKFSTYIISPPKKKQSFEKYFFSTKTINMEKVAPKEVNYFESKERKIKEKKKEQIKKPNRKFDFQINRKELLL